MATQRDVQRERSREAILEAAAQAYVDRGYAATSIGLIAASVGQTKGAVYFHFPTKSMIAQTLVNGFFRAWGPIIEASGGGGARGFDSLRRASREVAQAYQVDVRVRAAVRLMRESSVVEADLPTPFVGWMSFVRSKLEEASADGHLRDGISVEEAAWHIVATFFGVQEVSHQLSERADLLERVDLMWDFLLPGLTK